jgi:hypothetical protein
LVHRSLNLGSVSNINGKPPTLCQKTMVTSYEITIHICKYRPNETPHPIIRSSDLFMWEAKHVASFDAWDGSSTEPCVASGFPTSFSKPWRLTQSKKAKK